jgi:holo-[acyl-carrier protein] synthase
MIHGIGTDIVRVARIQENLDRFGRKFAQRILTPGELSEFEHSNRPAHFLARRFAAKEATVKALGTGFRQGIDFHHIGVNHDSQGKPFLTFYGPAQALEQSLGIDAALVSLADEDDHAVAFVMLLSRPPVAQNP